MILGDDSRLHIDRIDIHQNILTVLLHLLLLNLGLLFLGILRFVNEDLRPIMEVVENESLDTVDIGVRHEDQALDLGEQGDGIRILTLDALEDKLIVLLVPDSGDSARSHEGNRGGFLHILTLLGIPGVLVKATGLRVRDIVFTILAVLTVFTVLTGSSKASVLTVDEPVAVVTDGDDRTVLTVLTVLTVGTDQVAVG